MRSDKLTLSSIPPDWSFLQSPSPPFQHAPDEREAFVAHMVARAALRTVLTRFDQAGIESVVVKGVATASLLYRNFWERPISDVDLRVRREDLARIISVARREDWSICRISPAYGNIVLRVQRFAVDIEASVGPPGLCSLSTNDILERARVEEHDGYFLRTPELHDHVLLLCVNVFKDKIIGANVGALRDLELVAKLKSFDVDEFVSLVRRSQARTLVWIVADWMASQRDNSVWCEVRDALAPPRYLYRRIFRALINKRRTDRMALRVLARVANDAPLERIHALLSLARWVLERYASRDESRSTRH
jgi:hypothetical protein